MKARNFSIQALRSSAFLAGFLFVVTSADSATLYWDPNTTTALWGSAADTGTWGASAFWTTDSTGAFTSGVTSATSSVDVLRVNNGNLNLFKMSVSGDVHAQSLIFQSSNGSVSGKIDALGNGVLHLHGVGSATPAIDGAFNDTNFQVEEPIVLEQPEGAVVYLGVGVGNNGSILTGDTITSTNSVNVYFNCTGNNSINGRLDITGSVTCNQASTAQQRSVTFNGVIGGGVTDITQNGGANTTLVIANPSNLYTGKTIINSGKLSVTGATSGTGNTIVNGGTFTVSGAAGSIHSSAAITINGGNLTLTNTSSAQGSLNRVKDDAPVTSSGGTLTYTNSAGNTYAETLGAVAHAAGQLNVVLTNHMSSGSQALTFSELNQSDRGVVTFSSSGGLNDATNMIKVSGAVATAQGGIIAPWATTGTTAVLQTDYAIHDASSNVLAANISATTEDAWTGGISENYTSDSTAITLTGSRTMNSWRYNAAAGSLSLDGNFFDTNGILNGGSGLLTVSGVGGVRQLGTDAANLYVTAGSNSITISAPILDNTGALSLVKSGGGTLILSSTSNGYTGGTFVNGGILQCGVNNAIPGAVTVAGGTLDVQSLSATAGAVTLSGGSIIGGGTLTGSSYALTDQGTISAKLGGASVGLTKTGVGTVVLSGSSTYTGVTTINEGVLSVTTIKNGGVAGNIGQASTAASNLVLGGGTLRYTGATDSTTRNFTLTNGTTSTIEVTTNPLTISGASANTTGALVKAGAGTLTLSGANLHSGLTTVGDGTLAYGANNALGSGAVAVAGGTLDIKTFTDTVGAVTMSSGSIIGTIGVLTGTSYAVLNGTISANLAGDNTVNLAKTGAATVILSGANTYGGTSTVSAGTLQAAKAASLPGFDSPARVVIDGGTLAVNVGGGSDWTTGEVDTLLANATRTSGALGIDTTNAVGGNLTQWTAFTAGNLGAAVGLTKLGGYTLTLDQANTYPGPTTVRSGTLLVNGTIDITSVVTVNAGGTLGGSGAVYGAVTCAGRIAPGAGVGTLTTGPTILTGTLAVEVDDTLSDQLAVNGELNVSGATLNVSLLAGGFTQGSYVIATGTSIVGTFASVPAGYSVVYTATQLILNQGAPEIAVEQPESADIAYNGSKDFGLVLVGSDSSLTFTIRNTGNADLSVLPITVTGTHAGDFTVTDFTPPVQVPGSNGTTTFTVHFVPGGIGARSAALHIANNDSNENPFHINLSGTGTGTSAFDIWAQVHITDISPGADATQGGDPDLDGAINLYEFAFNGNPLSGSDNGRVYGLTEDSDSDPETANKELILTVAARKDAVFSAGTPATSALVDGITYVIEGGVNLSAFGTGVTPVADVVTGLPPDTWPDYDYFSFSLDGSNGLTGIGFLRAGVEP